MGRRIWKWVSSPFILFGDEAQIGCFKYIYMKKKELNQFRGLWIPKTPSLLVNPKIVFGGHNYYVSK